MKVCFIFEVCASYEYLWYKSPTSFSCKTLWASLKDDNQTFNGRQEGRQRTTLIVIKNYFVMLLNKVETDPTLKNGAYSEKPNE